MTRRAQRASGASRARAPRAGSDTRARSSSCTCSSVRRRREWYHLSLLVDASSAMMVRVGGLARQSPR